MERVSVSRVGNNRASVVTPIFLLGRAGSGKTHRCLTEIAGLLRGAPDGPPLLFIAPRQSTFLLERQLLSLGVPGFTRLEILSFDRLARRLLEALGQPVGRLLSEEGRVMALRALLVRHENQLQGFRQAARAAGFAVQLSQVLRELQRADARGQRLRNLRLPENAPLPLQGKMADLTLLLGAYRTWLREQALHDPDEMLWLATEQLAQARREGRDRPRFTGVWLDGFAEMTLPEIHLLAELLPDAGRATLAFCLNSEALTAAPAADSLWRLNATTVQRCRERLQELGLTPTIIRLPENPRIAPRFQRSPTLAHLASSWTTPPEIPDGSRADLNLVECADPEAEALLAARLINDHVRSRHVRYREISVIVRRMEDYAAVLHRTFRRHNIPFFTDHREPMAHHPVAELTRRALRLAALGGRHDDWIAALKTGLVVKSASFVDYLENVTLARGVRENEWQELATYQSKTGLANEMIQKLARPVAAFRDFQETLGRPSDGPALATALRALWTALQVPEALEKWQETAVEMALPPLYRSMHHTAWEQLQSWCDNLALAFSGTTFDAADWLAIAEAGLSSLTLGVIPPSLDQVFIGAVDRARHPEVKLTILLGLNAGVFPAPPAVPPLLNRAERLVLQSETDLGLGWDTVQLAARENYYAYIAGTRASERLCVSWSRRSLDGKSLARSSIAEQLLTFVGLRAGAEASAGEVTQFDGRLKMFTGHLAPETVASLPELLECPRWDRVLPENYPATPVIGLAGRTAAVIREQLLPAAGEAARRLEETALARLYPEKILYSSVSALETFAQCPFRHFAGQQLRLKERDEFQADTATLGTLLHAILHRFHTVTREEQRQWREWVPEAAATRIRELGEELLATPEFARQSQDPLVRWESEQKIEGLAVAVEQMITRFATYSFDPVLSEFQFRDQPAAGGPAPPAPAWPIPLREGRTLKLQGSLDRLDVYRTPDGEILVSIYDYKSGRCELNEKWLQNGLELQLLSYLAFAVESDELKAAVVGLLANEGSGAPILQPAGAFNIPLSPQIKSAKRNASDDEHQREFLKTLAYHGRADKQWRPSFDSSAAASEVQQFSASHFKSSDEFAALLHNTRAYLRKYAEAILGGDVGVRPVRFSNQRTACDYCPFRSLCRFEPVLGSYRTLASTKPDANAGAAPVQAAAPPPPEGKP